MKIVKRVKGYGMTCNNCHTTFEAINEELIEKTEKYYSIKGDIEERVYHTVDCPKCGKSLRVEYSENYLLYENVDIEV